MDPKTQLLFDEASGDLAIGELNAAAEKYRQCATSMPECFEPWHALGMVLMKLGHYPQAIDALKQAAQRQTQDPLIWSSLSMCYVRNGQIAEAEAASGKSRIISWGGKVSAEDL